MMYWSTLLELLAYGVLAFAALAWAILLLA